MVTAVVAPGLSVLPSEQRVVTTPAMETAAVVEAVDAAIQRGCDAVLVIEPRWDAGARQSCALAVLTLGDPRVARLSVDLPPLAASTLAEQLGWLGRVLAAPGLLFACVNKLSTELLAGAWTRDVAKLERPAPTLAQHVRSMVPGTSFFVSISPKPSVRPARSGVLQAAGWRQRRPYAVVLAGDEEGRTWLRTTEFATLGTANVLDASPAPLAKAYYEAKRVCEIVGVCSDLQKIAERAAGVRLSACRWCGFDVPVSPCPFCGSRLGAGVA